MACVCALSPVFVDEVHAERVGRDLHQAVHGHVHVAAPRRVAGSQREAVVQQAAGVPEREGWMDGWMDRKSKQVGELRSLEKVCRHEVNPWNDGVTAANGT